MTQHILTIDDDALIRRSLVYLLEQAGYRASDAATAEDGLALAQTEPPDLVLLDIGLPGMDGLDALQRLRAQSDAPVIFLTARRRELEQALGLELGADDYVTKPFDSTVLLARIKAVLRRYQRAAPTFAPPPSPPSQLAVGDLVIDSAAHNVTVDGAPLELSPREFDLLHALAQQAGSVLTADDLLTSV
ncbi:MAG: response regulator transcription factor, partial [Caldilineaceae bacterium]|nr:response regulator transcription factor [Caldilineaceae bacterium]